VLTPREKGMPGSIERAKQLVAETAGAWMPQQFDNPANIEVHAAPPRRKCFVTFRKGSTSIITGVGTGGHITALAQVLKPEWPQLQGVCGRTRGLAGDFRRQAIAASDPGHRRWLHSEHPEDRSARWRHHRRGRGSARDGAPRGARGRHLIGISSGAALAAIAKKLPELPRRARMLGFNYDTGERYLSVEGFLPVE
jgi:cysteine synthase